MADSQLIPALKRLRSDLLELRSSLRKSCKKPNGQVTSPKLRSIVTNLAETWLASLSQRPEVTRAVSPSYLGDLRVLFQRLLLSAERATVRRRYDQDISAILQKYTAEVVVPVMETSGRAALPGGPARQEGEFPLEGEEQNDEGFEPTAFLGHSFAPEDKPIVDTFIQVLQSLGIKVTSGSKPAANSISNKVKGQIEAQHIFIGIFTRREKLPSSTKWTTSTWVMEEKAYAIGRSKKLILLKEEDVENVGGLQGDYEYIEFRRDQLHDAIVKLLKIFTISVDGIQSQ